MDDDARRANLIRANATRSERAQIKQSIKSKADAAKVILTTDSGIPTEQVVQSIPYIGARRSNTILLKAGVKGRTQVGGSVTSTRRRPLTERERGILAGVIEGRL